MTEITNAAQAEEDAKPSISVQPIDVTTRTEMDEQHEDKVVLVNAQGMALEMESVPTNISVTASADASAEPVADAKEETGNSTSSPIRIKGLINLQPQPQNEANWIANRAHTSSRPAQERRKVRCPCLI